MPAYADLDSVRRILQLEDAWEPQADDATARLESLNAALSATFDAKVGRTWAGAAASPATREIWPASPLSDILPLPGPGILSLTSVTVDPTWSGSAWVGGYGLPLSDVLPDRRSQEGAYLALRRPTGWYWHGLVLVRAIWADDAQTAPDDVVEALNFLVAEEYKAERASPESQTGPDGMSIPTRNPWRFERVKSVIDAHRTVVI